MSEQPLHDSSEVVTTHEAAKRLGVHPATVRRWVQDGRLPAVRVGPAGRIRIATADLARMVRVA